MLSYTGQRLPLAPGLANRRRTHRRWRLYDPKRWTIVGSVFALGPGSWFSHCLFYRSYSAAFYKSSHQLVYSKNLGLRNYTFRNFSFAFVLNPKESSQNAEAPCWSSQMQRSKENKEGRLQISLSLSPPRPHTLTVGGPFPFCKCPNKDNDMYSSMTAYIICITLKALAVSCKFRNSGRGWLMAMPLAVMFNGNLPVSNSSGYSRMQQRGHCDFLSGLLCHLSFWSPVSWDDCLFGSWT